MKRVLFLLLNVAVSAVFLWLAFREIDFVDLYHSLFRVNYVLALISVFVNLVSCWLRAVRWRYIMTPVKPVSVRNLYSSLMIGFMVNNILPFRLGEFMRGYVLKRSDGVSFSASIGTIVIERLMDVLSLLIIFGVLVFLFPFPAWLESGSVLVFVITAGSFGFIYVLVTRSESAIRWLGRAAGFFSESLGATVSRVSRSFIQGINLFHSFRSYAIMTLLTIVIWATYVASIYVMLEATGLSASYNLNIMDATIVMIFSAFAVMIPAAPGYVGTFHEIVKQSLLLFGVNPEGALSFAILFHAYSYVSMTAIGLYYFVKSNYRLADAFKASEFISEENVVHH